MKKFIITVLVVVLVFSMTACASKKHISIDKSLLSDIQSTSNEDDLTAYNITENSATANTDETTEITTSDITDSSSTETKHTSGENTAINSSGTENEPVTVPEVEQAAHSNTTSAQPNNENNSVDNTSSTTSNNTSSTAKTEENTPSDIVEDEVCLHVFGDWTVTAEPTCGKEGLRKRVCNNCSEEDSEAVAKTDEHTFVNNKCQCGKTQDSVGLAFTKRSNYYFVSGIGECTDSCIVVPSYYEGLPVRSIAAEAFSKVTSFEEIILPETLCTIGRAAFSGCKGLKEITIPSGIEILDFETFTGCTNLEKVTLPSGLLQIFEYCFSGCTSLKEINLPDSLLKIRESAFYNCTSLKSISLPFSLNEIQQNAFMDCSSLSIQYLGSTSCFQQITKGYDWAVNTRSSYVQCYGGKVSIHTNKVVNK